MIYEIKANIVGSNARVLEMVDTEGWTGYKAVTTAWEEIPFDCSGCLDDRFLPP